jgi:hypothetical protein
MELTDDAIENLKALLDLVHYDSLALDWAAHVPMGLLPNRVIDRFMEWVDKTGRV